MRCNLGLNKKFAKIIQKSSRKKKDINLIKNENMTGKHHDGQNNWIEISR